VKIEAWQRWLVHAQKRIVSEIDQYEEEEGEEEGEEEQEAVEEVVEGGEGSVSLLSLRLNRLRAIGTGTGVAKADEEFRERDGQSKGGGGGVGDASSRGPAEGQSRASTSELSPSVAHGDAKALHSPMSSGAIGSPWAKSETGKAEGEWSTVRPAVQEGSSASPLARLPSLSPLFVGDVTVGTKRFGTVMLKCSLLKPKVKRPRPNGFGIFFDSEN
jgi:hypothetical protein